MAVQRWWSRRQVLVGLGRGGAAAVVLGSAAACSDGTSGANGTGGATATGPAGSPSPSGTGPAAAPSAGGGTPPAGSLAWQRVNLGFVSAYVLVRGNEAAVVDTGVEGSADAIGEVLDAAGPGWAGVRHVVLTHHHGDHAGSLGAVLERAASATGYIGAADLEKVTSPRPLTAVEDGDEVFGLTVVGTPGHTAGHVSVLDPETGVLVGGDAMNNTDGLAGANPRFTEDMDDAAASLRTVAGLDVRTVLFGHGEPLESDAAAQIRALARI
jgi:glyoxylase-like metal-dependent hydrolase (beta-lactamase superfamily II)